MRILLAFDKYKGSLNALEVSAAAKEGFKRVFPDAEYETLPIADGGEGFTHSLVNVMNGSIVSTLVEDALGREVEAEWGLIPLDNGELAGVIEMSAASGLWRINNEERDVMKASTYGTGQLIKVAAETPRVTHLYVGLGGSATNDAGTGMAQALGVTLKGITGRACPYNLSHLEKIRLNSRIPLPSITVACDVDNPLCGERGASAVFGAQKGASVKQIADLDELLGKLAELTPNPELKNAPGAGAAGGLGFGMMLFTDAELVSGFDLVAEAINLEDAIISADLIITGEGGLDAQSMSGKGPIGVAKLAQKHDKPCMALAGMIDREVDWNNYFKYMRAVADNGKPLSELIKNASYYLQESAQELAKVVQWKRECGL